VREEVGFGAREGGMRIVGFGEYVGGRGRGVVDGGAGGGDDYGCELGAGAQGGVEEREAALDGGDDGAVVGCEGEVYGGGGVEYAVCAWGLLDIGVVTCWDGLC
jgi:hypothetical protein